MPIRPTTLKTHGEKYILIDGSQSLGDALQRLGEHHYQENEAYLVVAGAAQQYRLALFSELRNVVAMLGYDSFTQPLQALPIPSADRVVPTNTPEGGQVILDWVACNPQSTLVVVEGNQVVGLLANPNRSGLGDWLAKLSLLELHGKLVDLGADARAYFEAQVEPPVCPHCGSKNFFKFDPQKRTYNCPGCGQKVSLL
jgi:DNA-directed RNA polymerase subunit RPC12/RpoP